MSLLVASKFGIAGLDQSLAGLVSDLFLKKIKEILAKIWLFWMIGAANKNIKIKKNKRKRKLQTIMAKFWDILMFDQILLSPQVKGSMIINNKHGMYELPHNLPEDLRLRILRI